MNRAWPAPLLALALLGCGAADDQEQLAATEPEIGSADYELSSSSTFTIPEGSHDSTFLGVRALKMGTSIDRTLTFRAIFTSNVPYATQLPTNQGDWCKLMGITTNRIHHNSIRLGWRWLPTEKMVELGFYGYIQGERISKALTRVPLNQPVPVEIRLWNGGESVTAGGVNSTVSRSLGLSRWVPTTTWVLETAYFGGDETAPHDITIRVDSVAVK